MMKLLLSLTLIWALTSTGEALVCETCTNVTCSNTSAVTCPTERMCITASIQAVSSGTPGQQIYKACAPPSLCPATGSQTFSVNLGVSSSLASATCCNTDSCNSNILPFPVVPADNSLQCHVCNPIIFDCSLSVQCRGTEDRCFEAVVTNTGGTSPAFGCASTNLCAAAASLGSLPFMQDVGTITSGPACCGTSLCNTVTTVNATSTTLTTTATTPTTTTTTPTTTTPTTTTTTPTTTTTTPTTTTPKTATITPTTTTTTPTTTTTTTTTTATTTTSAPGVALVCETCTDADVTCSNTSAVTCPTGTMCITASNQAVSSGTPGQQIYKACAPPSLCPATGSQTFSVNLGVSSSLVSATCCNTDSCNSNILPFPVVPVVNSLRCHVCNPITFDCSLSVQCRGTEDRCFEAVASLVTTENGPSPAFGCASSNLCAAAASLGSLPFVQDVGNITSGPACCGTSFCNTVTTGINSTSTPTTTTTTPTTTTTTPTTTTTTPTTTTTTPTTTTTTPTTTTPTTTTTTPTTTITTPTTTTTTTTPTTTTTTPTTTTTAPTTGTIAPTTTTTTTTAPGPVAIIYLKMKISTSGELSNEAIAEHINQFMRMTLLNGTAFTVNVKSIQRVRVAPTTTTTTSVGLPS